jgi:hypothetical protein
MFMMAMMWLYVLKYLLNLQLTNYETHENEKKAFRFMGGVHDLTLNRYTSIYVYFIVHHLKNMFNID